MCQKLSEYFSYQKCMYGKQCQLFLTSWKRVLKLTLLSVFKCSIFFLKFLNPLCPSQCSKFESNDDIFHEKNSDLR